MIIDDVSTVVGESSNGSRYMIFTGVCVNTTLAQAELGLTENVVNTKYVVTHQNLVGRYGAKFKAGM